MQQDRELGRRGYRICIRYRTTRSERLRGSSRILWRRYTTRHVGTATWLAGPLTWRVDEDA
jgi:hypothetical protein